MPKNERALPDGFMTVGKLAERMGVTVRTLQYYDREGLLSPTAESGGGRRLYTDKDMIQLHQILSLKYSGFFPGRHQKQACAVGYARRRCGRRWQRRLPPCGRRSRCLTESLTAS